MCKDYERILRGAQSKGIDPSLEPMKALIAELGNPCDQYEAIQVVGTNGKTSTARYLASVLRGEGLRVGLYLSPMLQSYTDQVEVNGREIAEDEFSKAVVAAYGVGERLNERRLNEGIDVLPITEFELVTAAALLLFAWQDVDVAVLEAGMGGLWDATSAVRSIRAVGVTGIALDHTRFLGPTVEEIAKNKAAVIRPGRACVLGPGTQQPNTVRDVFASRCARAGVVPRVVREQSGVVGSDVSFEVKARPSRIGGPLLMDVQTSWGSYADLGALKPAYQAQNVACAIALAEAHLGRVLNEDALFESIVTCRTPGRFDMVRSDPPVLVDACHNPQSVEAFLCAIQDIEPQVRCRPTLLCAIFADKDVTTMVALLAAQFPSVVVSQTKSPRALPAHELAQAFCECGLRPEAEFGCVEEAVAYLGDRPFVACGSITTAAEVSALFARGE